MDPKLALHLILHMFDDRMDIFSGRPAEINYKSGMFLADTGISHAVSLEPRIGNQLAGKIPFGRLKVEPALGYSSGCFSRRR